MRYIAIPAVIGSFTLTIPQVVRLIRQPHTEGVSILTWGIWLTDGLGWMGYGIIKPVWPSFIANVPTAIGAALVLTMLIIRGRREASYALGAGFIFGGASILLGILITPDVTAWFAASLSFVIFAPQVVTAIRSNDLRGVSAPTWLIALAASMCWMLYGIAIKNAPVTFPNIVVVPMEAVILYRIWVTRRHANIA